MLVHGYVLINATKGKALKTRSEVAKIAGVKSACAVTGAFDIIVTFEVESIKDIGELVVKGIQGLEGISCTQTAICVEC